MMVLNQKYITKQDIFLILGIIIFSLVITLISFEYGVATCIAMLTVSIYALLFEKSIDFLIEYSDSKFSVISMYIIGLLRYVFIGGGVSVIFFLFSSFSIRIYTVVIVIITWFIWIWVRNRR